MFAPASSASLSRLASAAGLILSGLAAVSSSASAAATFVPQAQPTAREQYLLELINRARANPAAEGAMLAGVTDSEIVRYYSHYAVDPSRVRSDFAAYKAQPPLAFNPLLMATCRTQALDQAAHGFQGHDGWNGSTFDGRITATGYQWHALGENTFAYAENAFFGHVGLNTDWGVPDLDHRRNIMNTDAAYPVFKEVGISCVSAANIPGFGPLVITEDFGTPRDANAAFVTGVIYSDANGNGFYDEGEGLAGVTVTPDQGETYTTTSGSGGFSLPLPAGVAAGQLSITASGGALGAPRLKSVSFVAGTNVKVDFTPADKAGAPEAQVAVRAVSKVASTDGSRVGVVTVSRTGGSLAKELAVTLSVGGTAVSGVDYSALPGSVTIPAGQSAVTIRVQALIKPFSGVKKVKLHVTAGTGYLAATGKATTKVKILQ